MKIKYGQLNGVVEAVGALRKQEQDFATARKLLDVCDALKKEESFFREQLDALIKKYAKTGADGKPEMSEDGKSYMLADPEAFAGKLNELAETETGDLPAIKSETLQQFKMSAEQLESLLLTTED